MKPQKMILIPQVSSAKRLNIWNLFSPIIGLLVQLNCSESDPETVLLGFRWGLLSLEPKERKKDKDWCRVSLPPQVSLSQLSIGVRLDRMLVLDIPAPALHSAGVNEPSGGQ